MSKLKKKKKVKISKRSQLILAIIDDLKNNEYESRQYIYDLVGEALNTRTIKELKQILYGE